MTIKDVLSDGFWIMPSTPPFIEDGEIPYITSKNIKVGEIDFSNVQYISQEDFKSISKNRPIKVNDFLISMIGTLGNIAIVKDTDGDFYGQNMYLLRLNPEIIDHDYFYHFFNSDIVKRHIESKKNKSTQGYLKANHIEEIELPVPSLNVQKKIASYFKELNSLIDTKRKQISLLDELINAYYTELMDTNDCVNTLGEFISSCKAERCGKRDLPVLSITKDDGIVLQSEKFKKRIASADVSTYKIVPRDTLVQGIHIDERNFAIQNIVNEGIVSPAYKLWNVDTAKAIPEVLAYALRTDRTMAYIRSKFTGSVKRRESIKTDDFMLTPINLPDLNIQKHFATLMKQSEESKMAVQHSIAELEELKKSLMQKYFG